VQSCTRSSRVASWEREWLSSIPDDRVEPEREWLSSMPDDRVEPEREWLPSMPDDRVEPEREWLPSMPDDRVEPEREWLLSIPDDRVEPDRVNHKARARPPSTTHRELRRILGCFLLAQSRQPAKPPNGGATLLIGGSTRVARDAEVTHVIHTGVLYPNCQRSGAEDGTARNDPGFTESTRRVSTVLIAIAQYQGLHGNEEQVNCNSLIPRTSWYRVTSLNTELSPCLHISARPANERMEIH
jgi:hypothetical protein